MRNYRNYRAIPDFLQYQKVCEEEVRIPYQCHSTTVKVGGENGKKCCIILLHRGEDALSYHSMNINTCLYTPFRLIEDVSISQ